MSKDVNNEKDKAIEKLFDDYRPSFPDSADFMACLDERLEAVEYIKQQERIQLRRYRYATMAALVLGIVCGAALCGFLITLSSGGPLLTFDTRILPLIIIRDYSNVIILMPIVALLSYGIIKLYNMVTTMLELRAK